MKIAFLNDKFSGRCRKAPAWITSLLIFAALILSVNLTAFSAYAATTAKQTAPASGSQTNSVSTNLPVVVEIPKSVFIWNPKEPGFGRDPFFPKLQKKQGVPASTDTSASIKEIKPQEPPKPKPEFVLNGLIGKMICIVNGKQIMVGNTEMVPTAAGKIKVRCDKIEDDIAFITIFNDNGTTESRELNLKSRR